MPERLRIVLAGGVGSMPFAGVAWQVLHHLEGLRRLGHEVFYLEDTERWPYDPVNDTVCDDVRPAISYVAALMARCGLEQRWAYRDVASGEVHGAGADGLRRELATADVLVNLSGVMVLRDEHLAVPARVYLETDPVAPQIEIAQGRGRTLELLGAHTHHVTYATNLAGPDCGVPATPFAYIPALPPVVLDWWEPLPGDRSARPFTTVANWRQRGKEVEWQGRLLTWSKEVEFERFRELPRLVERPLELALALDDERVLAALRAAGWRVVPARPLSSDADAYRDYVRASAGEFSAAKEQNVALRSGWFSDRSATYLASGSPVVLQDTGFGAALPTGAGLFAVASAGEAAEAIAAIDAEWRLHSESARAIAAEHFEATRVLGRLLEAVARAAPALPA